MSRRTLAQPSTFAPDAYDSRIDRETAEWVAAEELLRQGIYELADGDVIEVAEAELVSSTWVVYYDSKRYLETGDASFALAGNGPVLVAPDYRCEVAGSGLAVPDAVIAFEKRGSEPEPRA